MSIKVFFGQKISAEMLNFPRTDLEKIFAFKKHLENNGFEGLEGRNKCSDNVPYSDPCWSVKVAYAQKHSLWHYHIGIIKYDMNKPFGDRTSEYVVHYQRLENIVKIIDYSAHPPLNLPTENYLR
ncbi:hypothetical protein [Rodentibacter genomosp. 2]|uniref:Uncharacterized protein n=1 Tax=Rodentibacter genomosp. 2 TaxID=1908266 RepID=A0A1V3J9X4_9PAST|nr:hypothetical protein [Rodentibacter genomosp. 2]OOF52781.1 hypothetical protein BKK55_11900 [Rodentibacter genomosp. 2]